MNSARSHGSFKKSGETVHPFRENHNGKVPGLRGRLATVAEVRTKEVVLPYTSLPMKVPARRSCAAGWGDPGKTRPEKPQGKYGIWRTGHMMKRMNFHMMMNEVTCALFLKHPIYLQILTCRACLRYNVLRVHLNSLYICTIEMLGSWTRNVPQMLVGRYQVSQAKLNFTGREFQNRETLAYWLLQDVEFWIRLRL